MLGNAKGALPQAQKKKKTRFSSTASMGKHELNFLLLKCLEVCASDCNCFSGALRNALTASLVQCVLRECNRIVRQDDTVTEKVCCCV